MKLKNFFMIGFLAVAGIFGVTAGVVGVDINNNAPRATEAATATTVYYSISTSDRGDGNTVKVYYHLGSYSSDPWGLATMSLESDTYNGNPVYKATFTDSYDGLGELRFQMFKDSDWRWETTAFTTWTSASTYNGKLWAHGTSTGGTWKTYTKDTKSQKTFYLDTSPLTSMGNNKPYLHYWNSIVDESVAGNKIDSSKSNNWWVFRTSSVTEKNLKIQFQYNNYAWQTADITYNSSHNLYVPNSTTNKNPTNTYNSTGTIHTITKQQVLNGGSPSPIDGAFYALNALPVTIPTIPTVDGYSKPSTWKGNSSGGGTTYTPNSKSAFTSNISIYALYTANNYGVTITAGTGVSSVYLSSTDNATSGSSSGTEFSYNSTVYGFAVLSAGYKAKDGWTLVSGTANTAGAIYRIGSRTVGTSGAAFGTIDATAQTYTVTVNLVGGTGASNTSYTFKTTDQTVSLGTPTKDGKDFAGYTITTQPTGGGATITSNTTLNIPANAYGGITVTAQWSDGTYTIVYNTNGGSGVAPASQTVGVGSSVDFRSYSGTKTGHTLYGWNTADDGTGTHYDIGGSGTPSTAKGGTLTLYADWHINSHAVTATVGDGVSSVYLSTSSTATSGDPSGTEFKYGDTVYVFAVLRAGWTKGDTWTRIGETTSYRVASHSMEDATYDFGKIEAVATTYSITYNTNGGGAIAAGSYTIHASNHTVALTTPTRTGYTFTGYTITTNTTGGTSSVSTKTTLNIPANAYGNVTVEAGWSVNSYTVTLNTNGGTINAGNVTSYTYGYGATLPTNVTKTAYSFGGWYDNSGLTGTAVTSISTTATGNKTYWAKWNILNNKYYVSINGTKTLLNTKTDGAGDVIYQLSPASKLTVWGGDKIGFYDGSTLLTTAVLSADVDPDNNVVSTTATDNLWEINNYNGSADLYFKLKTDGTFVFWLSGKESRSETSYGVTSGDTFYVQDLLIKNNQGSNFGANNAKIAVYFYNPVGESSSIHKWSTEFATLQKSEGGVDLYSLTVPTYNGHSMKWGGAIAVRFASDMTVGNLEAHGFDWCIKKDDNPNMKNGVNPGNFADDSQNTIQIQYWWGESLPGGYNASGNYTMYIDAGLASGTGIYVDPTNAYGGWDFKGDTSSYHIYGYFFSIVDGDGEAFNWSAAAHKVDGETNLYEIEVPKDRSGNNVEWGKLIVVYSPSAGWVTEQNKYQTQDLWYSSALQSHTHITFTGNSTGELKSEASHDATYTDATRAERWGTNFLSNVTCNNGVTAPSTAGWGTSSTDYSNMSTAARTIVTNSTVGSSTDLQSAVTRYDYIVNKYGSDAYSDFAHRVGTANFAYKSVRGFSPFETLFGGDEESMSSTVIIIASSVSLLSLTALGVLILKKRKARP